MGVSHSRLSEMKDKKHQHSGQTLKQPADLWHHLVKQEELGLREAFTQWSEPSPLVTFLTQKRKGHDHHFGPDATRRSSLVESWGRSINALINILYLKRERHTQIKMIFASVYSPLDLVATTWLNQANRCNENNNLEVEIYWEEMLTLNLATTTTTTKKSQTPRKPGNAGRQISDAWRSGVLTGWDGWDPESVEWAVMHRRTCQAQLAPCDPTTEREKEGRERAQSEQ